MKVKSSDPCVIGLGANSPSGVGPPLDTLTAALDRLEALGFRIVRRAPWIASPAYPPGAGPDFVNGAVLAETALAPEAALAALHQVETDFGRIRSERYGPRSVDLDLICWGDRVAPDRDVLRAWIALPRADWTKRAPDQLLLPHPRLQDRAFVLAPLTALAPDWRHPVLGRTAAALWAALPDAERDSVRPLDPGA